MTKRYIVRLEVISFDRREDALAFQEALVDAFCDMPEAKDYAATSDIEEVEDDPPMSDVSIVSGDKAST